MAVVDAPVDVAAQLAVVRPPRVGGLDDPAQPETQRLAARTARSFARLDRCVGEPVAGEPIADDWEVVAAIEMHGLDVYGCRDSVQSGLQQSRVVTVGGIDRPADRYTVSVNRDRPLLAAFAPVTRVRAGAFATVRGLGQAAIEGDLGQIETDDAIERGASFRPRGDRTTRADPLVPTCSQRRVRCPVFENRFDVTHDEPIVSRIRIPRNTTGPAP